LLSSIFKLLFFVEASSPILISYHLITCVIYPDLFFFFCLLLLSSLFLLYFPRKESFHRTFLFLNFHPILDTDSLRASLLPIASLVFVSYVHNIQSA
jgi:hypothetical protein